ncbi:hypothetical protein HMI54_011032 [Coelomomyces lativittatus]|nr:hypothetical protein HMI56_007009 [Coelomomyces lativittatus]KAJ1512213.1 hypothetical protein HMI55_006312 [Coelomomyces lativittatus]KAJ1516054.1 hypothetical protein HMI54_011032 [Coelomomyces lativittatus]
MQAKLKPSILLSTPMPHRQPKPIVPFINTHQKPSSDHSSNANVLTPQRGDSLKAFDIGTHHHPKLNASSNPSPELSQTSLTNSPYDTSQSPSLFFSSKAISSDITNSTSLSPLQPSTTTASNQWNASVIYPQIVPKALLPTSMSSNLRTKSDRPVPVQHVQVLFPPNTVSSLSTSPSFKWKMPSNSHAVSTPPTTSLPTSTFINSSTVTASSFPSHEQDANAPTSNTTTFTPTTYPLSFDTSAWTQPSSVPQVTHFTSTSSSTMYNLHPSMDQENEVDKSDMDTIAEKDSEAIEENITFPSSLTYSHPPNIKLGQRKASLDAFKVIPHDIQDLSCNDETSSITSPNFLTFRSDEGGSSSSVTMSSTTSPQFQSLSTTSDHQSDQRRTSTFSSSSSSSYSLLDTTLPLDSLRQWAKKSSDSQAHWQFFQYLIELAEKLPTSLSSSQHTLKVTQQQQGLMKEAVTWLKKLAYKKRHMEAMMYLADCHGQGYLGLPIDLEKAFQLYLQCSQLYSHPQAAYRVAVCYEQGLGVPKIDLKKAFTWFMKAKEGNDPAALYKVGLIHLHGQCEQPSNLNLALACLHEAAKVANATYPHALHELGLVYHHASEVIDQQKAYHYFYEAASLFSYPPSQHQLGVCFQEGWLGTVDPTQSLFWFTQAAEVSYTESELALSGWYFEGALGVLPQNDQQAYAWAKKAALKGFQKAEFVMGYYHEIGVGVVPNIHEARVWYQRAAAQGYRPAMQRLLELSSFTDVSRLSRPAEVTQKTKNDCIIT